jgi:hypothetical protein
LLDIASNQALPDDIQDAWISCFPSLALEIPHLFDIPDGPFPIVLVGLLQVGAEITDATPWDYDANDTSPARLAIEAIGTIGASPLDIPFRGGLTLKALLSASDWLFERICYTNMCSWLWYISHHVPLLWLWYGCEFWI